MKYNKIFDAFQRSIAVLFYYIYKGELHENLNWIIILGRNACRSSLKYTYRGDVSVPLSNVAPVNWLTSQH